MVESTKPIPDIRDVFDTCYDTLVRRLAFILHDRAAAEDVAQEAFIQLMNQGVENLTTPERWLLRVGTNLALNHLRGERNRRAREMKEGEGLFKENRWRDAQPVEEEVGRHQEVDECQRVLGRLAPRDREVLMLRHSGFSYAEVALILGVEKSSVGTILSRAMERFKLEYQKESAHQQPGGEVRCVLI
ncbi:MAG: sigma-70 family RNA polymerase sigma factor [Firmicutes bacterium]|nr:sigma-70 family RNA polymerase sigma factor [Bacillota bacterium]